MSNEMKNVHNSFVSGGEYSSNPNEYLEVGYTSSLDNNLYKVTKSTMKSVGLDNPNVNNDDNSFIKLLIVITLIAISGVLVYFNRIKILNFLKLNN